MSSSDAKRLRELEQENAGLKKLLAEQALEEEITETSALDQVVNLLMRPLKKVKWRKWVLGVFPNRRGADTLTTEIAVEDEQTGSAEALPHHERPRSVEEPNPP